MTTVASTTAAPSQSLEEDDKIEIAMLNYGDINNNPLEYGSMINTTENSTFDKMNKEAKTILKDGIKKEDIETMFSSLKKLINNDPSSSISKKEMLKVIELYEKNIKDDSFTFFKKKSEDDKELYSFDQKSLFSSLDKQFGNKAPLDPASFEIIKDIFSEENINNALPIPLQEKKSANTLTANKLQSITSDLVDLKGIRKEILKLELISNFFDRNGIVKILVDDAVTSEDNHLSRAKTDEVFIKNNTGLEKYYFKVGLLIYHYLSMLIFIETYFKINDNQINDNQTNPPTQTTQTFIQFLNEISDASKDITDTKDKIVAQMGIDYDIIFFNEINQGACKELKKQGHVYFSSLGSDNNASAIFVKSGKRLSSMVSDENKDLLHSISDTLIKKKYIERLVINFGKEVKDVCYLHIQGIHCFSVHFDSEKSKTLPEEKEKKYVKHKDKARNNRKDDVVAFIKNTVKSLAKGDKFIIAIDTNSSNLNNTDIVELKDKEGKSINHYPTNINDEGDKNMTVNKTRKYTQSQIKKADDEDKATKDIFFHNLTKVNDNESDGIYSVGDGTKLVKKKDYDTCPNNKYPFDHFMVALKIQHDAEITKTDADLTTQLNKTKETAKMTNEIVEKVITDNPSIEEFKIGGGSLRKRSHKNNKRLLFTRKRSNKKNKKYSFINNNKMRGGIKKSKLRNINFKKSRKNQKLSHKRL
tara:strand:- start:3198 stop:5300 length:2103 start_codon:yes stop_codon:yes gene_type:complete